MTAPFERCCLRCVYHGRVQGVGFRATTVSIAARYPVDGYVRNQPDGTVEMLVAGRHSDICEFCAEVQRRMDGCIVRVEEEAAAPVPLGSGFQIRYS